MTTQVKQQPFGTPDRDAACDTPRDEGFHQVLDSVWAWRIAPQKLEVVAVTELDDQAVILRAEVADHVVLALVFGPACPADLGYLCLPGTFVCAEFDGAVPTGPRAGMVRWFGVEALRFDPAALEAACGGALFAAPSPRLPADVVSPF